MKHGTADKLVYSLLPRDASPRAEADRCWLGTADAARWESDCESGNESEVSNDFADEQELQLNTEEILSLCA